jgi:hypothetical protein
MWAIYAFPGGRWMRTGWVGEPGARERHGPFQWFRSLEEARAGLPPGVQRFDPEAQETAGNPALVETWE